MKIPVLLTLWALLATASRTAAQPVANPLPLELTQDGVTLHIMKAGFYGGAHDTNDMPMDRGWAGTAWALPGTRKSFIMRYQVTRQAPVTPAGAAPASLVPDGTVDAQAQARARDDATVVRLYAPTGEPLEFSFGQGRAGGAQQLQWPGVDPHWDHVTLDAMVFDPAAPLEDGGRAEQMVTFTRVPFPAQPDTPLDVEKSVTAKFGTEVTLNQVTTHYHNDAAGKPVQSVEMVVGWTRPEDAPDLRAQIQFTGGNSLTDAQGAAINVTNWGSQDPVEGPVHITLQNLPRRDLGNFSIRLKVLEIAPSRRRPESFRHFRCDLKLPPVDNAQGVSTLTLATTTGGAAGLLEPLMYMGEPTRRHAVLWVRQRDDVPAPPTAPGMSREWVVSGVTIKDQDGHSLQSWFTSSRTVAGNRQPNTVGWRSDGRLTAPGELGYPLTIVWDGHAAPQSMTIEATAAAVLHQHQFLTIKDIPVPAPKASLDLNLAATAPMQPAAPSRLILRHALRITNARLFHKLDPSQLGRLRLGGVALLFEAIPGDPRGTLRLWPATAETDSGQSLLDSNSVVVAPGNLLPGTDDITPSAKSSTWWTVFLLPPTHSAKTLQMQFTLDEDVPTGDLATLRFADVKNVPGGP